MASAKSTLKESQTRKLRQSLKKLENEAPLKSALSDPGEPMGLLAKALVGAGQSKAQNEKKAHCEEPTVIPGALHVTGELVVTSHVLVLGDVIAKEITIGEGGSLAVSGTLESKTLYCGGHLHVAKSLNSTLVTAFDCAHIRAASYQAALSVYYAYCALDAQKISGAHYNFEHGVESDDPQYLELVSRLPKACVSQKDADFGVLGIDFGKLMKVALLGKLTLRS